MDNKSPSSGGLADMERILEAIKAELSAGLNSVKKELKADLKTELDAIRTELKAELDGIRTKEPSPRVAPVPPPPPEDFSRVEAADRENRRKTEDFSIKDFSGIEVGGAFDVEILRGDGYSVSISGEDDLFKNLDASKEGQTLRIRHSRHMGWRAQLTRPRARITLPLLREVRLSGATRATVSGFSSSEALRVELSGASSISGEITAGNVEIELSGASRAKLTGSANDMVIEASGANAMDLSGLSMHNAAVRLGGASHLTVKMDGRLDARLSGVSHLGYVGNPTMGNIRTSGASRISKE